ncbi:MoxR family ATPase [Mycobacterium sp. MYCO198283]|uniref:AAA family ATPase n=1 Tax=Mycobacterium sp. MYCO198283 TaxID=2883505 RepID=UPI001E497FFE|nr:MoxR family ATPase [Mycobacterium sp. MYCO198283]MCG5433999.1 MoxR family ATPase [Mycobacterium sp. MYCO198283]
MTSAHTPAHTRPDSRDIDDARRLIGTVSDAFSASVVGQQNLRESLLIGLLCGGHVLLESVPGLAKTTAARVIAESINGKFSRIQCTPDLLPSDIIGTQIYEAATNSFVTQLGPVHSNIVLLDEINRSSAKTQSAMLEAMEERQTTIAGVVYPIPEPFLVIATQNPVDQEGTYPLSEAQTDRFLLKDVLRYPSAAEEVEVIERIDAGVYDPARRARPVISLDDVRRLQQVARGIHMDRALIHYASQLVAVTRDPAQHLPARIARLVEYGASPRATIAFSKAGRALALLSGRSHVLPEDIARLAHRVLRHRLILGFEAATAGITPDAVVDAVLQVVRVP